MLFGVVGDVLVCGRSRRFDSCRDRGDDWGVAFELVVVVTAAGRYLMNAIHLGDDSIRIIVDFHIQILSSIFTFPLEIPLLCLDVDL